MASSKHQHQIQHFLSSESREGEVGTNKAGSNPAFLYERKIDNDTNHCRSQRIRLKTH